MASVQIELRDLISSLAQLDYRVAVAREAASRASWIAAELERMATMLAEMVRSDDERRLYSLVAEARDLAKAWAARKEEALKEEIAAALARFAANTAG